jgi:hypothetical protein
MPDIHAIYRYPIKGLSPELLLRAALTPRETIPGDGLYAVENGPSGFNPASPAYHFLMLMKNERLASLRTSFDQATHTLTIETLATNQKISAELHTAEGRAVIEHFRQLLRRRIARGSESPARRRPQLFRSCPQGGIDHQPGLQTSVECSRMSALCQKQTSPSCRGTLPPDLRSRGWCMSGGLDHRMGLSW